MFRKWRKQSIIQIESNGQIQNIIVYLNFGFSEGNSLCTSFLLYSSLRKDEGYRVYEPEKKIPRLREQCM